MLSVGFMVLSRVEEDQRKDDCREIFLTFFFHAKKNCSSFFFLDNEKIMQLTENQNLIIDSHTAIHSHLDDGKWGDFYQIINFSKFIFSEFGLKKFG
jgi:hypothetical protein